VNITNPVIRRYIYGIMVAVGGVLLVYGIVNSAQLGAWLILGGAITGVTNLLALTNTPDGKHEA